MKKLDFMGHRKIALAISCLLLAISVTSLALRQLNWGLDFTGGTLLELHFSESVNIEDLRSTILDAGEPNAIVVSYGTDRDALIRLPKSVPEASSQVLVTLIRQQLDPDLELKRQEFVGPQVGEELREQGGLAMLLASACIMLYISFRFQARFAVASVAALIHDVIITLGFFSLTGMEFNLTVLAAILAVIGYSINDTIVVFDRIRENFRKLRIATVPDTINISISETMDRTLATSFTTVLVLVALAVFGGEMILGFATALLVGICVGTYSSIFIASSLLQTLGVSRQDLLPPALENDEGES
ncbi:protein translocase subunit SecF [Parahaliea aestuarii]|uniref:Protein-export membrane protein SecF n=1 Tax=Parahaliea aestuarii TaxID=1852021 RepID=A0A5C8ZV60_9GAMM|nr:protein translocase subunit SecF [Parahaliea aestuarii]TXS92378.1 protein translocase subunit SecF [Parahaliea aestuarii]